MAKNDNISMLDTNQLSRRVMDAEHDAIRVTFAHHHEMDMSISGDEGDSIQCLPRTRAMSKEDACLDIKRLCVFAKNPSDQPVEVRVDISPLDSGDDAWFPLAGLPVQAQSMGHTQPLDICARRIRVQAPDGVEVNVIGQS